jgi:hypothetical protein
LTPLAPRPKHTRLADALGLPLQKRATIFMLRCVVSIIRFYALPQQLCGQTGGPQPFLRLAHCVDWLRRRTSFRRFIRLRGRGDERRRELLSRQHASLPARVGNGVQARGKPAQFLAVEARVRPCRCGTRGALRARGSAGGWSNLQETKRDELCAVIVSLSNAC